MRGAVAALPTPGLEPRTPTPARLDGRSGRVRSRGHGSSRRITFVSSVPEGVTEPVRPPLFYVEEPERLHGWLGDLLCDALEQISNLITELDSELSGKTVDARALVLCAVTHPPPELLDPPVGRSEIGDQLVVGDQLGKPWCARCPRSLE